MTQTLEEEIVALQEELKRAEADKKLKAEQEKLDKEVKEKLAESNDNEASEAVQDTYSKIDISIGGNVFYSFFSKDKVTGVGYEDKALFVPEFRFEIGNTNISTSVFDIRFAGNSSCFNLLVSFVTRFKLKIIKELLYFDIGLEGGGNFGYSSVANYDFIQNGTYAIPFIALDSGFQWNPFKFLAVNTGVSVFYNLDSFESVYFDMESAYLVLSYRINN